MTDFGEADPREMPAHLFAGARRLHYASAVRADIGKQNRSICPRYWYVDATFSCARCGRDFTFTAGEQRTWYEEYAFWIDSCPRHCLTCRHDLRQMKTARQAYDAGIERALSGVDPDLTRSVVEAIDQLYELGEELPPRLTAHRRRLARQIEKRAGSSDPTTPTGAAS